MSSGNFVDLRITHAGTGAGGEDSVWPAFTDIMTVVVMIFLMALLAFLLRNTQLLDELQTTLIAKDQVTQQALQSEAKNTTLEDQLAKVRSQILSLESSLNNVSTERDDMQTQLQTKEQIAKDLQLEVTLLAKLRDELTNENSQLLSSLDLNNKKLLEFEAETTQSKNVLNEKISILLAEKAGLLLDVEDTAQTLSEREEQRILLSNKIISLSEQLRVMRERLSGEEEKTAALQNYVSYKNSQLNSTANSKEQLQAKLDKMVQDLEELQSLYDNRGAEVSDLEAQMANAGTRYKSLQEEYDSLDEQYRKLIRPARSPAGKVVVEVAHAFVNGEKIYSLKGPQQSSATRYSFAGLNTQLAKLKAQYGQQLYTKILIGEDSGLSYNDAWSFTTHVLSKYDYYSQDTVPAE